MGPHLRHWLALAGLSFVLAGCPTMDDDDTSPGDDDDATSAADDDDSAGPDSSITSVTFAATLKGEAGDWTGDHGGVTDLHGTLQLIYWDSLAEASINCRQRVEFDAQVRFGDAMSEDGCEACVGRLRVSSAHVLPPDDFDDGCTDLPAELDMAFLAAAGDVTEPSDFRSLDLMPAWDLLANSTPLGAEGELLATDVIDRYATAGLEVLHVATISPTGWLADEAGLGDVAAHWPDGLPMFVIYADGGTVGSPVLHNSTYLSTLWTVRVGAGLTADSL
ncbi:MAG: hypothetical protein GY898_00655 [Proteobacteria bacterium]|nr:hypothetical protein [Pseudomonadota bacterium]